MLSLPPRSGLHGLEDCLGPAFLTTKVDLTVHLGFQLWGWSQPTRSVDREAYPGLMTLRRCTEGAHISAEKPYRINQGGPEFPVPHPREPCIFPQTFLLEMANKGLPSACLPAVLGGARSISLRISLLSLYFLLLASAGTFKKCSQLLFQGSPLSKAQDSTGAGRMNE